MNGSPSNGPRRGQTRPVSPFIIPITSTGWQSDLGIRRPWPGQAQRGDYAVIRCYHTVVYAREQGSGQGTGGPTSQPGTGEEVRKGRRHGAHTKQEELSLPAPSSSWPKPAQTGQRRARMGLDLTRSTRRQACDHADKITRETVIALPPRVAADPARSADVRLGRAHGPGSTSWQHLRCGCRHPLLPGPARVRGRNAWRRPWMPTRCSARGNASAGGSMRIGPTNCLQRGPCWTRRDVGSGTAKRNVDWPACGRRGVHV